MTKRVLIIPKTITYKDDYKETLKHTIPHTRASAIEK